MKHARIAIVGVGSIGSRHIDTLLAMGYKDLVGIDTRQMPQEERLPVVETFEDIERWNPTHALICSPPEWHYHHAKYFVDRGIPTFIEKPITVSKVEASELCATARLNKSILAVGYMERAHPAVKQAKEFIEKHGCTKAQIYCYWRTSRKTYELSTAIESSHAIDTAQFLLGRGRVDRWNQVGDEVVVFTEYDSGSRCMISMNMHEWQRRVIVLFGKDGEVFREMYGGSTEEWDSCYRDELQAFLDGVPLCTGKDGLNVVDILEQLK